MTCKRPALMIQAQTTGALLRAMIVWLAAAYFLPAGASASPTVIVTIDVESNESLKLPLQMDAVCEGGTPCGVMQIARMLEDRGMTGTFFLNVYEYRAWGEPALREIARRLEANGHEVALHTHPQWAYDPDRANLFDYSLDEQTRIVREGRDLLQQWTGLPVVSHRAGAYTADRNTLEALRRNGIHLDSSLFLDHPLSRLNGLGLPANRPGLLNGVTEIPVTVYKRRELPSILGSLVPPYTTVRKIDVNWLLDGTETTEAFDAAVQADLPFIVVFLHSYSFMAGPGAGPEFIGRPDAQKRFELLLDRIRDKQLPVRSFRDIASSNVPLIVAGADTVPEVTAHVPAHHYLFRQLRKFGWPRLAAAALATLGIAGVMLLLRRRRRRAATPTRGG